MVTGTVTSTSNYIITVSGLGDCKNIVLWINSRPTSGLSIANGAYGVVFSYIPDEGRHHSVTPYYREYYDESYEDWVNERSLAIFDCSSYMTFTNGTFKITGGFHGKPIRNFTYAYIAW